MVEKQDENKTNKSRSGSSYCWKHRAEKKYPHLYIPNGAMVAALIYSGFKIKAYPGTPHVHANMAV